MRIIWLIMRKDLLRRWRSPLASLVFLAFPFVFSALIALAFGTGGEGRMPRFKVALVDEDRGFVAGLVRGAFGQERAAQFLEVTETTHEEAMQLIEHNRVAGAIVIPAGFTDAVLDRRPTELRVIRNPAEAIGPIAVEETAEFLALFLEGAASVLSGPIERIRGLTEEGSADGGAGAVPGAGTLGGAAGQISERPVVPAPADWAADERVAEIAVAVNHALRGARDYLLPPAIRLERADAPGVPVLSDTTSPAEPAAASADDDARFLSIFKYVLPGMATFALFVLAVGLTADVFRERRRGTLARQLAAPLQPQKVVVGKMLATMGVGLIVALLMALIGALFLGARANPIAFLLLCVLFLLALTGFVNLLYSFARSEQRGATLASIVMMLMAFLGGSFIPLEAMPEFVQRLAVISLNYWAIEGFQALLFSGAGVAEIARPLVVFLAVGLVSVLLGGALLRGQLARGD
ncbi:MAG: ABC-2 transporter permease [Candidatus Eisenbacteria sp.]|nr:ABC-2 transporter permease [Candidatus Eisenbacteria bacterium]